MKQIFLIILGLILTLSIHAQQKAKQYAVKSGHVEYKLTGNTTGTKSLWWDNYGQMSYTETKATTVTKIFGMKSEDKAHTIQIMKGDKFWTVNVLDKTGQKGTIPAYSQFQKIGEDMSEEERNQMGKDLLTAFGGEIIGSEKILGNTCEIATLLGAKVWIYKGITLKSEAKILGVEANEIALSFVKNASVSSSKFNPPSNISYEDQSQYQQAIFGDMGDYNDEEEMDFDLYPIKYPYQKFKEVINDFSYNGYRKLTVMNSKDTYSAMFMKGMSGSLAIAATSKKNGNPAQEGGFETFTHNGVKCMYGAMDEDDGVTLIVDIPRYETYIIIAADPVISKNDMLGMLDKLKF